MPLEGGFILFYSVCIRSCILCRLDVEIFRFVGQEQRDVVLLYYTRLLFNIRQICRQIYSFLQRFQQFSTHNVYNLRFSMLLCELWRNVSQIFLKIKPITKKYHLKLLRSSSTKDRLWSGAHDYDYDQITEFRSSRSINTDL